MHHFRDNIQYQGIPMKSSITLLALLFSATLFATEYNCEKVLAYYGNNIYSYETRQILEKECIHPSCIHYLESLKYNKRMSSKMREIGSVDGIDSYEDRARYDKNQLVQYSCSKDRHY